MPSLEGLSAVIANIHDAGGDGAEWITALARVGALFEARTTTVWMQKNPSGDFRAAQTSPRSNASTPDYKHHARLDRLRFAVTRAPVGTILTNDMVVPRSEFARTEFYTDYVRRHGLYDCMQARVFDGSGYDSYLVITSDERVGAFEREDIRLLRLLLPHLRRVMQIQRRLASLALQRDTALEALDHLNHGVLIVDAQARVTYANGAAEVVLRQADGIRVEATGRGLRAAIPGQTSALRRLVAQAAGRDGTLSGGGSGALRIDRATGVPLLLCVVPVRAEAAWNVSPQPAALVLIGVPEHEETLTSPAHLRALYDLTPAEAAVAGRIAEGQGAKTAAEALSIAPSTLRWHLQRVFEKTGTTRQAELARLVGRLGAVTRNGHG